MFKSLIQATRQVMPTQALVAASPEQRIGLLYWLVEGLEPEAAPVAAHVQLGAADAPDDAVPLAEIDTTAEALKAHGVRAHAYMLEPGNYRVRVTCGGRAWAADFTVREWRPLQARIGQALRDHGTPLLFSGPADASHYPYGREDLQPWFDRPDAESVVEGWLAAGRITPPEADSMKQFHRDGYIVMEDAFDDALVAQINAEIDEAVASHWQGYQQGSSQRLEQLHQTRPGIRSLWLNTAARRMIEKLFGGLARPCQTLTYVFGSQQDAHQDTIHLTPFPAGMMCGLWIALQDVEPDSGELVIYPGSHREPRVRLGDVDCAKVEGDWSTFGQTVVPRWADMTTRHEPVVYRPRKGTALIWHENLLHAGSLRRNPDIERRSVVIHYFAGDAVAYYDSTGHPAMAAPESLLVS